MAKATEIAKTENTSIVAADEAAYEADRQFFNDLAMAGEGIVDVVPPTVDAMQGAMSEDMLANALMNGKSLNEARRETKNGEFTAEIIGIAVSRGQVEDTLTKRLRDAVITCFITSEGEGLVSASAIVYKAVLNMLRAKGRPSSWKAPVRLSFSKVERGAKQLNIIKIV